MEFINDIFETTIILANEVLDSQKPVITIITPYYNNSKLMNTVQSVLKQSYSNIEYIIADDCSIDSNRLFDDMRNIIVGKKLDNFISIKIQKQHKNIGTVKNLNNAIKASQGEFIFILASDDIFFDCHVIEKWVDFMQKKNAMISTAKRIICKKSISNPQCIRPSRRQIRNLKKLSCEALYHLLAYENYIIGCCTAYSKNCFERYGYFDEKYKLLEDHPMVLKLLKNQVKIDFWDNIAIYYMDDGVSGASNYNLMFEQDVERLLWHEAKYQGHDAEKIVMQHRIRKDRLILFYKKWRYRRYIDAIRIYPKQAIKEALKPVRGFLVKIYIQILKMA